MPPTFYNNSSNRALKRKQVDIPNQTRIKQTIYNSRNNPLLILVL